MAAAITVSELSRAAVKGTRLEHPRRVAVDGAGLLGDRRFQLVRVRDGLQLNAHRTPLGQVDARWDDRRDELALTFPDGTVVHDAVRLGGELAGLVSWDHLRPLPGREVEGPFAAAFSELLDEPVRLAAASAPTHAIDVCPVTLVSRASIARLERELDEGPLGTDRFRMNVVLDGASEHEEDGWYGRRLRVGGLVLRVTGPVPRCAVTTRDPTTGRRDRATLHAIGRYRDPIVALQRPGPVALPFGVYAEVERPGTIAVGDRIELLDA